MACFLVPAAEAIVTTALDRKIHHGQAGEPRTDAVPRIRFGEKLGWLSRMLWGGSALLAFEHVWHGELVPWAPFLTAAGNPADFAEMLQEMATSGVGMACLVTAVWAGMVAAANYIVREQTGCTE